jgi:dTDP-4-amino-4,6-dideoxygalactose transaminase
LRKTSYEAIKNGFLRPHMEWREIRKEAFDTNWIAPLGANVNGLESDLESYLAEDCSVGALSSGTAALHLG